MYRALVQPAAKSQLNEREKKQHTVSEKKNQRTKVEKRLVKQKPTPQRNLGLVGIMNKDFMKYLKRERKHTRANTRGIAASELKEKKR